MFVLTEHYNEYDQQGDYLVTVFNQKPSYDELMNVLLTHEPNMSRVTAQSITENLRTKGGGRRNDEHNWFFLSLLTAGQLYEHSNGGAEWK